MKRIIFFMCQLLGISANRAVKAILSMAILRERSRIHSHGWGFAFSRVCREGGARASSVAGTELGPVRRDWLLVKKPEAMIDSPNREIPFGAKSKTIIGHIRLASCGAIAEHNTHPFVKSGWAFAHNGTVTEMLAQPEFSLKRYRPEGETDSEYAFLWLLEQIEGLNPVDRVHALAECADRVSRKAFRFNFLLSNGKVLYAFGDARHGRDLYYVERTAAPFMVYVPEGNFFLDMAKVKVPKEKAVVIATEPMTEYECWKRVVGLQIFSRGELLPQGAS
jgi:glutamine amidotransferase